MSHLHHGRINLLIATTIDDAREVQWEHPRFKTYHVVTPRSLNRLRGWAISNYCWTPDASALSASKRMELRTAMSYCMDEDSREEKFPYIS